MDRVFINDLLVRGIIGIYPTEREKPQDILINFSLSTDLSRAGETDDIKDSIDYAMMAHKVQELVASSHRYTLEALAADIAQLGLAKPSVTQVSIRLEKPEIVPFTRSVGIEIERVRKDNAR